MDVINYLKQKATESTGGYVLNSYPPEFNVKQTSLQGHANQIALEKLTTEFAIKVKSYPVYNQYGNVHEHTLHVLNYDQIESPKTHPIVMECRSLIIDADFNVVSRSFDRFFNFGEAPETQVNLDITKDICYEKVDGSLIKIYNWNGKWYVSSRGTAFAESSVGGFELTFKDLVLKALKLPNNGHFQSQCNQYLNKDITYICEVTSMENRVVKTYKGYKLHFLAARNNKTFEYDTGTSARFAAKNVGCEFINTYAFSDMEKCIETVNNLPDLEEGYVVYSNGRPIAKIKSPAYVAVHAIRGEGLNPKRIMQLVLANNVDEYLKYFPEDTEHFLAYNKGLDMLLLHIKAAYGFAKNIENQKDFAMEIKDTPYSAVLFQARKLKEDPIHTFHQQTELHKMRMLEAFV